MLTFRVELFQKSYICVLTGVLLFCTSSLKSQSAHQSLNKVLTLTGQKQGAKDLPQDKGITGIWQRLLKLQTTTSVLHTQAHPDDEHADLLTYLSRGKGARTAILSLNRGESGGNALGKEFFDPLGLIRTEEFLLASSYYGLDDLYFTNLVDYGFSKRVDESYEKWEKQNVLNEMVRVIRINRPLVIISRFHGSVRDGHGNHQAAGEISQLAFSLAGDPAAFPEQISKEGLKPWQPLKLYRGGVRQNERWNIGLNTGQTSPWLGDSYRNFALHGYSLHRSQTSGNRNESTGPFFQYYERVHSKVFSSEKENSFFEGIDTSITGIFSITGEKIPDNMLPILNGIKEDVANAVKSLDLQQPSGIIPSLTSGLQKTRAALQLLTTQQDALFLLRIKEKQFIDAINTTLGIYLEAIAMPLSAVPARGFFSPKPTMGFVVPGARFKTEVTFLNKSHVPLENIKLELVTPSDWKINIIKDTLLPSGTEAVQKNFTVQVNPNVIFSFPYFHRHSIRESQYTLKESEFMNLPWAPAQMEVTAKYQVNGEMLELRVPVQVRKANLPFGLDKHTLKVVPAIAVNIQPRMGVIPVNATGRSLNVNIELVNNADTAINGILQLSLPAGWKSQPEKAAFSFLKSGEKNNYSIKVVPSSSLTEKTYEIEAVATANGIRYSTGYDEIKYRDLDITLSNYPSTIQIKGISVKTVPGVRIGYIMGVGDEIPSGLQQLGCSVQLLTANELSTGKLENYDVIMVGTRAYAVRQDLHMYNQRLLDYTKNGGHLIVLFQTPEFIPTAMSPYPAKLPGNAEEISEENSPIKILRPEHRVFHYPNIITLKDFDNWEEQRGSKFFSEWDPAYMPLISTEDNGQTAQSGGWLMAKYGKGNYTYNAYAFHRQLPYGVAGAYRIMANLVSYGKEIRVKTK